MTTKIATFLQVMLIGRRLHTPSKGLYNRITPAKSRSFCMKTFIASLTKLTDHLPHSHDGGCYKIKRKLVDKSL
jgi:hypothetical protein